MRPLADPDFLALWERGKRLAPLDQALLVLAAALPGVSGDSIADWPLGSRNQALAELRCACFGASLQAWTQCSVCGERLEIEMDGRALAAGAKTEEPVHAAEHRFRLPTSRDLAAVATLADLRDAAIALMQRCLLDGGNAVEWNDDRLEDVGNRIAAADPMAETTLALSCPRCSRHWDEPLDIAAFFWAEIESRARRLLRDTHVLASTYGWTEGEIFALSPPRRAMYVEMVQG